MVRLFEQQFPYESVSYSVHMYLVTDNPTTALQRQPLVVNDNNRSLAEIPKSALGARPHGRCSIEISQRRHGGVENGEVARSETIYSCGSFETAECEKGEADYFDFVRGHAIYLL
jgi:hypothetical protein